MNEDIHQFRLLEARRFTPAEVAENLGMFENQSPTTRQGEVSGVHGLAVATKFPEMRIED
jgi:hypothetical protein